METGVMECWSGGVLVRGVKTLILMTNGSLSFQYSSTPLLQFKAVFLG